MNNTMGEFFIPRGIGFSKRIFVVMALALSLIAILFVYFLNHYSHRAMTNSAQSKKIPITSDVDVSQSINRLERHKYKPITPITKNDPVKNTARQQSNSTQSPLSDNGFKTAGDSSLSVYHAATQFSSDVDGATQVSSLPAGESSTGQSNFPSSPPDHYTAQNAQNQKIAFLKSSSQNHDVIGSQLQTPTSQYQIMAGTIIPATLVTGINSDLPGTITAKVSRDIFDSVSGNYLLIPQGTTIIGAYDSQVTFGQSRVLIAWQRLIFPNGNSFDLNGMPGADLTGMAGLSDLVNHHYSRIFGSALLMSVFGAAGQLSQPQNSKQASSEQIIYGAVGQQMSQTSAQLIAKNLDIQPTIQIRPGANFNVLLTRDMVLPGAYHFS